MTTPNENTKTKNTMTTTYRVALCHCVKAFGFDNQLAISFEQVDNFGATCHREVRHLQIINWHPSSPASHTSYPRNWHVLMEQTDENPLELGGIIFRQTHISHIYTVYTYTCIWLATVAQFSTRMSYLTKQRQGTQSLPQGFCALQAANLENVVGRKRKSIGIFLAEYAQNKFQSTILSTILISQNLI